MPSPLAAPTRRTDRWIAVLLSVGLWTLYAQLRQAGYWSDGRNLLIALEAGRFRLHHIGYLPLAQGIRWLTGDRLASETLLHALSSVPAAIGTGLGFAALRAFGVRRSAALAASLLAGFAPVTLFFATCIEVHALQYLTACGALLWVARTRNAGPRSAFVAALFLSALFAFHMTGLLWGPALAVLATRSRSGWARPRHALAGLTVLLATAWIWTRINAGIGAGPQHIERAWAALREGWRPHKVVFNLIFPLGIQSVALLGALHPRLRPRGLTRSPEALAGLVLLATALPFAVTFLIPERGAYYITLVAPAALATGLILERAGRAWVRAALLAVPLQLGLGIRPILEWDRGFPGREWLEALVADTGGRGVVLTRSREEWKTVQFHSRLLAISPAMPLRPWQDPGRVGTEHLLPILARHAERGHPIAVSRTFWEWDDPVARALRGELVRRFGPPHAGRSEAYLLFVPDSAPPGRD